MLSEWYPSRKICDHRRYWIAKNGLKLTIIYDYYAEDIDSLKVEYPNLFVKKKSGAAYSLPKYNSSMLIPWIILLRVPIHVFRSEMPKYRHDLYRSTTAKRLFQITCNNAGPFTCFRQMVTFRLTFPFNAGKLLLIVIICYLNIVLDGHKFTPDIFSSLTRSKGK